MINSLIDLLDSLQSEEDCREFLEAIRWDGGRAPICPHCGSQSKEHYKLTNGGNIEACINVRIATSDLP